MIQRMSEPELLERAATAARLAMRARTGNGFAYFFRMAVETDRELQERAATRAVVSAMLASVPENNARALATLAAFGRAFTMTAATETNGDNGSDNGDGGSKVRRRKPRPQPPSGTLAELFAAKLATANGKG
jgi:hypothetical protein